jgi:hypothetical protein
MTPLDFEILQEEWNIIELEDNTIIRFRPCLLFITRSRSKDDEGYQLRTNMQLGVWAKTKGEPTTEVITDALVRQSVDLTNLKFRFLKRGVSSYRIEGGDELQLVATPTQIDRTSLVDKDGEPVYSVHHELQLLFAKKKRKD